MKRSAVPFKLRMSIVAHYDGRCALCERESNHLELHHLTPVSDGGKDEPDNIIPLCHECHREIEIYRNRKEPKEIPEILKATAPGNNPSIVKLANAHKISSYWLKSLLIDPQYSILISNWAKTRRIPLTEAIDEFLWYTIGRLVERDSSILDDIKMQDDWRNDNQDCE